MPENLESGDFLVFGVLDVMPGVYRATNAVVSRLSGSIHTSSESLASPKKGSRVKSEESSNGRHS